MSVDEVLRTNGDAIVGRWLEVALGSYPEEASALFRSQQDPFANPVGHALRTGLQGVVQALAGGADATETCRHLQDVLSIRAVQDMPASKALGFIFELKEVLRAEAGATDGQTGPGLEELDRRVDRIALAAFDAYARCRERVYELRINEVKRQVPWSTRRTGPGEGDSVPADGAGPPPEDAEEGIP